MANQQSLKPALTDSAEVVTRMLESALEKGKVKGFKRSVPAFIGYLVAHEAYHHGEIGVILGQSGHGLNKDVA